LTRSDLRRSNHLWARVKVVPRASALVRGMPVLDAQSSMPFTLLEKQMIGEEESDIVEGDGGGWWERARGQEGRGSGKRRVLEDEREAPSS
jgi:hypothetical protein